MFRPSEAFWYILQSSNGQTRIERWGLSADVPLQGDYDGDGKSDLAVWRSTDGGFWISGSSGGTAIAQLGLSGDIPPASSFVR